MPNDQVTSAFSLLLEEFDSVIDETNKQGATAFAKQDFELLQTLIEKAKALTEYQEKVGGLEEDWAAFAAPKNPKEGKWSKHDPARPVAFHAACMEAISANLRQKFIKKARSFYISDDGKVAVVCAVSREYPKATDTFYWFSLHPYQFEFLESAPESYVALGCGTPDRILLFPSNDLRPLMQKVNKTVTEAGIPRYQLRIIESPGGLFLIFSGRGNRQDISKYMLPG